MVVVGCKPLAMASVRRGGGILMKRGESKLDRLRAQYATLVNQGCEREAARLWEQLRHAELEAVRKWRGEG